MENLSVCGQSNCEREREEECTMARSFVVVSKPVPLMADLNRRFIELDELQRVDVDLRIFDISLLKNRIERVLSKDVLDVGNEQLLMLLLVMDPKGQDRFDPAKKFFVGMENQIINV